MSRILAFLVEGTSSSTHRDGVDQRDSRIRSHPSRDDCSTLEVSLGGAALVPVVESRQVRDSDHATECWRVKPPSLWRVLGQREMRAAAVVVDEIGLDGPAEARLVEYEDVVQALAPNGPDQPFDVRPFPTISHPVTSSGG